MHEGTAAVVFRKAVHTSFIWRSPGNMEEEIDKPLAVDVDIDPDFEPQKRPRSCTWPLPRPESNDGKAEPADVGIIPEEEVDELGSDDACASSAITGASKPVSVTEGNQAAAPAIETSAAVSDQDSYGSPLSSQRALPACNDSSINGLIPQQSRKSSARRNAWGNYSYADLITQAIESSPEKRLTLAQVYDWMVGMCHTSRTKVTATALLDGRYVRSKTG